MTRINGLEARICSAVAVLGVFVTYAWISPRLFRTETPVDVDGGGVVKVIGFGDDAQRSRAVSIELARMTAARARSASVSAPDGEARDRAEDALAAYLVAHPEIAAPVPTEEPGAETRKIRLERERDRVLAQLEQSKLRPPRDPDSGDNPFHDGPAVDPTILKRRLVEIDTSLAAAAKAGVPATHATVPDELGALLTALPRVERKPPAPTAEVRVAASATTQLEPDLLLFGGLATVVTLTAAFLPRRRRRQESTGSLPRSPSGAVAVSVRPPPTRPIAPQPFLQHPAPLPPATPQARPASAPPQSRHVLADSPVMAYPASFSPSLLADPARYDALRGELEELGRAECFAVAVTAPRGHARSKAEVAAGLAASFPADASTRVLLVEGDLGNPAVQEVMKLEVLPMTDFATQLTSRVKGSTDTHWYVLKCSPALHVLASVDPSPDLLLSTHFEACIQTLRPFYDVIVVHAPALSEVVGCRAVNDVVDGVVLVVPAADPEGTHSAAPFLDKRMTVTVRVA